MSSDLLEAPPAEGRTVLVVENEVLIRMVIADYLRDCGYKVIEAADGDEALIVLEAQELVVDVVLSDVQMPGSVDGFGLSQWVRKYKKHIPVILAGSPASAANAAGGLCESGPYLAKPYEPQLVLDRIRRAFADRDLNRKRRSSSQRSRKN